MRPIKLSEPRREQVAETRAAADRLLGRASGENPFELREELGKLMWEKAGIVRDGQKLAAAISQVADLQQRAEQTATAEGRLFNLSWQQALDLRNLLTASDLIARSALLREESRGAHFRSDFPAAADAHWLKNIYLRRDGDGLASWTVPVKLEKLRP